MGVALALCRKKNVRYVPGGWVRKEFLRRQDVCKRELLTLVGKFKGDFRDFWGGVKTSVLWMSEVE